MEVASVLSPLNLDDLDKNWVKDVWEREFIENIEPPLDYDNFLEIFDLSEVLHCFIKRTKSWLNEDDSGSTLDDGVDKSWRTLVSLVQHKKLTALLFHLIHKGHKQFLSEDCRMNAILAARTYLMMLVIPGCNAYTIFHPQMYIHCLSCFKFSTQLLEQEDDFQDLNGVNIVNRQLKSLLNDLYSVINCFNLKSSDESIEETIVCLVEFVGNTDFSCRLDFSVLTKLSELAHNCINILIQPDEEDPDDEVLNLVFKALLPKFTFLGGTKKSAALWRASGIAYCGSLLMKYNDIALPGFTCLLQHLCFNTDGMERSENRSNRVTLVVGLLSLAPLQAYTDFLKWLVKLSRNSKPTLRLFALEVLGSLIGGVDRSLNVEDVEGEQVNPLPTSVPAEDPEEAVINEIAPEVPSCLQQVAHRDLVRVVFERCQDVISTVRTKAMAIMVYCTMPGNEAINKIIKEMFGGEESMLTMTNLRLRDERVSVRRAAMTLLENVLSSDASLVTKENLQPLVSLCRDTSLMVRCAAVNTLTGLAHRWAGNVTAEAWLQGPMHQLSDPETKVQELVVESFRLLIAPIAKYSAGAPAAERRPWILLNAVIRCNMRRHLTRVCGSLAKLGKVLTQGLMDILQTHVGTENNLPCWVLLSCVARHIPTTDVHFALDYYNDLTSDQRSGDERLLTLVLEVLREWWNSIAESDAAMLRAGLVRGLRDCRFPPTCMRGAVALAARLTRPGEPSWASHLMEEAEGRLVGLSGASGPASLLAIADVALAADCQPAEATIHMLADIIKTFDADNSGDIPDVTRAAAIAALGKLSLRDRNTAAIAAPLCAKVLGSSGTSLPLKVNAMCVLADLCTRFASIVEPLLSGVCACLGSPLLPVRRVAAQLVTQLLVGDFLRLRGSLYFHYFCLVCDPDQSIRDVANYYILQCLVQRNRNMLYHNFVECVFYYNGYKDHLTFGKFYVSDEERQLFTLQGEEKREIRLAIYDLMLSHMSDVQRLNTQVKLCKEAGAAGESGGAGEEVLRDALAALRRAARQPQAKPVSDNPDEMAARITTNIVSQKMKLNVVEIVVPTVMRLYRKLKAAGSSLIPDLVAYAGDLLREYKKEIEEQFEVDSELLTEIRLLHGEASPSAPPPNSQPLFSPRSANLPFPQQDSDTPGLPSDFCETPLGTLRGRKRAGGSPYKGGRGAKRSLLMSERSGDADT